MSTISVSFNKIFGFAFFLIAGALVLGSFGKISHAQDLIGSTSDSSYEKVYKPVMTTTSVMIDGDETPPIEPNIGQAKFFNYPELTSVTEQIDRLLHGIEIYVRPEYDQYGHEIRRYMAHIGDIKIYEDPEYLLKAYRNTKKAQVIAKFWKNHLEQEISQIEEILENDDGVPLSARTAFRQNRLTVRSFVMSLNAWVGSNEQILSKIGEAPEIYTIQYPEILIFRGKDRIDFHNLLSIRAAKLKDIRQYRPFALMVY